MPFIGILLVSLVSLALQPKRRVVDWLLFVFFGYLGFRYMRNVALFALAMYIPVTRTWRDLAGRLPFLATAAGRKAAWGCVAVAAVVTLGAATTRNTWGAGVVRERFPVEAARLIETVRPPGQLFNAYAAGGYFSWALYDHYRVSIDGRHYGMDRSFVQHNQVFGAQAGWESVLRRYDVTMIFTRATYPSGDLVRLVPILDASGEWVLVSAEPAGLLFFRRDVLPTAAGWRMPDQNLVWRQAVKEGMAAAAGPAGPRAYLTIGAAYNKLRRPDLAAEYLRRYLAFFPGDRRVAQTLALLERMTLPSGEPEPGSSKYREY